MDDIYCFFERASLKIIEPVLKEFKSLSTISKEYRKSLILSIDDTSLEVFGKNMQGAKKLHNGKKYFNGYHIVFIGLSLGKDFRIPISFRIYRPDTGETRIHLAAEMLDEIVPILLINPRMIAFDSLYLSKDLVGVIIKHGLTWVSKLKKNRIVGVSGNDYEKLTDQLLLFKDKFYYNLPFQAKVCVERMKRLGIKIVHVLHKGIGEFAMTYNEENSIIACSDKKLRQKRIVWFYKLRWVIEELFRIMKQCIAFTKVYYLEEMSST
ncbi:transposase [bacterium]|nr:transposase [bacterium]